MQRYSRFLLLLLCLILIGECRKHKSRKKRWSSAETHKLGNPLSKKIVDGTKTRKVKTSHLLRIDDHDFTMRPAFAVFVCWCEQLLQQQQKKKKVTKKKTEKKNAIVLFKHHEKLTCVSVPLPPVSLPRVHLAEEKVCVQQLPRSLQASKGTIAVLLMKASYAATFCLLVGRYGE
ncbi:gamma-aminobutyric acid receptor subunit rho-2-like protein [Lates japonicus]|uniref:Gamma-aminobutyric acid receptor subunit rho-2-like protein n=1 Tax=Lates japonicus TaxID=270547 RepID=A0AAD3RM68_LATJO|nr:gamma-aminobutyric acid receptor subunit rho-2-like protein [Lates japonicus]